MARRQTGKGRSGSSSHGSARKTPSWWERRSPWQKWLLGIVVAAVASTLTGAAVGIFNTAAMRVVGRVAEVIATPRTPLSEPLTVVATVNPPDDGCQGGYGWMRPEGLATPQPIAAGDLAKATEWDLDHGLIPANGNSVNMTVQNRPGQSVVLNALDVLVLTRRQPPRGVAGLVVPPHRSTLDIPSGCGPLSPRAFIVDLDQSPPQVRSTQGFDVQTNHEIPTVTFPYYVADTTTPEVFHVQAFTGQCDCDWVIQLHWVAAGKEGITRVTDHGKPFRTSATSAASTVPGGRCYGCPDTQPYHGPVQPRPPQSAPTG